MELLSPAKNIEIAISAINAGADAVYIGSPDFSARKSALNSLQDIQKLVEYAHLYRAKVYVTFNTIIYDNEIKKAQDLITQLYNIGVDALIIQDLGIINMDIPPIELHASTQCNNFELDRIKFIDKLGFKRIVLARELSFEQIKEVRNNVSAELECFVHGALCVSLSGNCYMSQYVGNRSANRGECSQQCRMRYQLLGQEKLLKEGYLLSLKDFNLSSQIGKMIDLGVNSFKIEGRLKDLSYVKNITAYYRQIIDNKLEGKSISRLSSGRTIYNFTPNPQKVFNRTFTEYFFEPSNLPKANFFSPKSMGEQIGIVVSKKNNEISLKTDASINNGDGLCYLSGNELKGFRVEKIISKNTFLANAPKDLNKNTIIFRNLDTQFVKMLESPNACKRQISVDINFVQRGENQFLLEAIDEDKISVSQFITQNFDVAQKADQALNNLKNNLAKQSDFFFVSKVNVTLLDKQKVPFLRISELNNLRRELFLLLEQKRIQNFRPKDQKKPNNMVDYFVNSGDYHLNVANILAKKFYEDRSCKVLETAFELQNTSLKNKEVMKTKYCIKKECGFCTKLNKNIPKDWQGNIFTLKGEYKTFSLKVDCKNCMMYVYC